MGWTGIGNYFGDTMKDRRKFIDNMINNEWKGYELIKSAMHNSTYYAAVKHPSGHVFGLVMLTSVDNREFLYKDMDETMLPYSYDCPVTILNLLSPTDNESAIEWRERCRTQHELRKKWTAIKSTPNVHIQVTARNLRYTQDGSEIILHRTRRFNGKMYWTDGSYRFSEGTVRYLTDGYRNYYIVTPDGQNYCDLNYYKEVK